MVDYVKERYRGPWITLRTKCLHRAELSGGLNPKLELAISDGSSELSLDVVPNRGKLQRYKGGLVESLRVPGLIEYLAGDGSY